MAASFDPLRHNEIAARVFCLSSLTGRADLPPCQSTTGMNDLDNLAVWLGPEALNERRPSRRLLQCRHILTSRCQKVDTDRGSEGDSVQQLRQMDSRAQHA